MSRIAFIFPGQGAQYKGMGREVYEGTQTGRKVFEEASRLLGFSMQELCFTQEEKLNRTEYTQAAMVTVSIALLRVLEERGLEPCAAAGLSLGEYAALAAVGVMSDADAIATVRQRGILMEQAVPAGVGSMAAVLGLEAGKTEAVTEKIPDVWIANYNCPGQIVISGKREAVEEACGKLKEAGARRCVGLNVSGPFHSGLLEDAGKKLGKVLEEVPIHAPRIPYVANVTAEPVREAALVKPLLIRQVSAPVRWQQGVERLIEEGIDTFIEIGPGKTLTGFVKKINRQARAFSMENLDDMERILKEI